MAIVNSALYQISIDDQGLLENRTYGSLFKLLSKKNILPLGLYRGTFSNMKVGPKGNKSSYVFTNPPSDTELFSCDKVFVLSQTPLRAHPQRTSVKVIQIKLSPPPFIFCRFYAHIFIYRSNMLTGGFKRDSIIRCFAKQTQFS